MGTSTHRAAAADATVDVAMLLLRCAAVGKHRDVFLNPLPPRSPDSFVWGTVRVPVVGAGNSRRSGYTHENDNVVSLPTMANRVWKATECCDRKLQRQLQRQLQLQLQQQTAKATTTNNTTTNNSNNKKDRRRLSPPSRTTKSRSSPSVLLQQQHCEQELFGFLYSLPWIERGKVTVVKNRETMNGSRGGRIAIEVCIDLDGDTTTTATTTLEKETETYNNFDSDASYSPRFAHFCRKHGSLTAYHGTHMDHVWSILNNGFWNMSSSSLPGGGNGSSGNEFVKNGAMLGSGVYLTTSHKVASFFATSGGNRNACKQAFANALQHGSLRNLLQLQLDDYDVSCFPVFEAKIIRPPDAAQDREGRKPRAGGGTTFSPMAATATNGNGNDATTTNADSGGTYYYEATRQEGKYYVVPDGRDIKITRLHLTFELVSKKRGVIASYLSQLLSNMNHHPILLGIIGLLISVVYLHCTSKKNDGYMV